VSLETYGLALFPTKIVRDVDKLGPRAIMGSKSRRDTVNIQTSSPHHDLIALILESSMQGLACLLTCLLAGFSWLLFSFGGFETAWDMQRYGTTSWQILSAGI
jgi:hypothetical protein